MSKNKNKNNNKNNKNINMLDTDKSLYQILARKQNKTSWKNLFHKINSATKCDRIGILSPMALSVHDMQI